MLSRKRRWRYQLVVASAATIVALVVVSLVGEWAVRYRERIRGTVPGTMSKLFYRHTRLMHALVRGTDYYGWVQIGKQGFRGPREVSTGRPDSVYRIIAVGGSTTFDGNTSGDSAAWPARLEQILDSVGSPRRFEVLNAGVPGYQVFDDLVRLQLELHRYAPDLLILYQGHNDLFNALARAGRPAEIGFNPRPDEVAPVYPWQRWMEGHSLLWHKVRSRMDAIRFRSAGEAGRARATEAEYSAVLEAGLTDFSRNVRLYLAVAQSLGIDVLVPQVVYSRASGLGVEADSVVQATWSRAFVVAAPEMVWKGYARFDSVVRAAVLGPGAWYLPATDPALWLADGYAGDDPVHFNDRGAWRMAGHLARTILARSVVNVESGDRATRPEEK